MVVGKSRQVVAGKTRRRPTVAKSHNPGSGLKTQVRTPSGLRKLRHCLGNYGIKCKKVGTRNQDNASSANWVALSKICSLLAFNFVGRHFDTCFQNRPSGKRRKCSIKYIEDIFKFIFCWKDQLKQRWGCSFSIFDDQKRNTDATHATSSFIAFKIDPLKKKRKCSTHLSLSLSLYIYILIEGILKCSFSWKEQLNNRRGCSSSIFDVQKGKTENVDL